MPKHPLGVVLNRLRTALEPAEAETTDRELLQRFLVRHEEAAFGELVRRHGPMVLGVCRRVLGDAHAAQDAFQATFLVLVRRARTVPWRESLGGWLHGTARRVALRARRAAGVSRLIAAGPAGSRGPLADPDPAEEAAARELRRVLDQELQGLPAKYRAPLVLCDMEGKTHEQAARELGWPKGSVAKRLNGARERLRARLVRRGVALSAGTLAVFTANEVTAAPTAALAAAALLAAHGAASTTATALAKGVMKAVLFTKLKIAAVVLATLAALGVGAGVLAYRLNAAGPAPSRDAVVPPGPKNADPTAAPKDAAAPAAAEPWGTIEGRVVWAGGDAPAPAPVVVDKDPAQCLKNGPIYKMDYVVNPKNKGVRWVVVWLVDADDYTKALPIHPDLKAIPQKEVVLDQPCCQFEPHIVCLRAGQTLTAKNSGTIPHNTKIDSPGDNPNLNPLIPAGASVSIPDWTADGRFSLVSCGIHPWMTAYVRVFDHPYFAVTDADGRFKIEKAPAGKYRIVAWQESVGYLDKGRKTGDPIEVKPGGVTEMDFPVQPKD